MCTGKLCTSIFFYPYTLLSFGGILVLKDIETVYVNKDFKELQIQYLIFIQQLTANSISTTIG